ncbi:MULTISPECIES: ABC transporter ATP-binding protein [unclassified Shinella]|uniref:ABC transporter ATP-binding protein n=1 Tax=unclassified Shinella TaxID=2643062 RepID=UPI00225C5D58|nr:MULTISPECIES: ABC transporter ATP-binding protein [unclassified Shinella]MCO5137705.1 ABC transporter ATP-binding protein [Shinella sp.]MDC7257823.1 ABC transporter ATP-binding protein [Shinella sp. YE25]CAI0335430.1 putative D,D-dipeptide ABC transporter ATP-binding subunit DdpD [Rhizobiaceae bacterium]CAK7259737.1 putative peptide ABC transporter ATP-binding protein y4tR [Shinella sp. WSC3-e]
MTAPLLDIRNLRLGVALGRSAHHPLLKDVTFQIMPGEAYGLVGESGSGKSITSLAVMGLLKKPLAVFGGEILFKGQNLLSLPKREMRRLRGNRIAMIFQEPMTALNPLSTVGRQIAEMFVLHQGKSWGEAEKLAVEALGNVRVPNPDRRAKNYPHQMSGGLRQRVMIAMALACNPDLLIADEPTTALDVTVQAEVLRLIKELCAARGTAVLFISHDLGVIASICQRVGVMYAGCLVEENETRALFENPRHAYTRGLLGALPRLGSRSAHGRQRLVDIDSIIADRSTLTETRFIAPRGAERGQL